MCVCTDREKSKNSVIPLEEYFREKDELERRENPYYVDERRQMNNYCIMIDDILYRYCLKNDICTLKTIDIVRKPNYIIDFITHYLVIDIDVYSIRQNNVMDERSRIVYIAKRTYKPVFFVKVNTDFYGGESIDIVAVLEKWILWVKNITPYLSNLFPQALNKETVLIPLFYTDGIFTEDTQDDRALALCKKIVFF